MNKPRSRPNLVFVFPDQMRGQAMGFVGREPVKTPVLDRFKEQSLYLPNAVANYPVCSPYRGMLMTGQYAHHNGVTANCTSHTGEWDVQLRADARCWSDVLHDAGYSLGYIGKWHLDTPHEPYIDCLNNRGDVKWNEWCPPERRHGFDYWHAYGTYDQHLNPMYWSTHAKRNEFRFVGQWGPAYEADRAIEYIRNEGGNRRDADKPFALVVSMNPPHMPYDQVPLEYVHRYDDVSDEDFACQPNIPPADDAMGQRWRQNIRNQSAMITGVDEQFGRILDVLDQQGIADDTIVVFTSDHGDCLGIHGCVSKNVHYEESMRVPFLVRFPGRIPPRQENLLVSTPDIYPTLLWLMGLADDIPDSVDGTNHADVMRGSAGPRPDSQPYMRINPEHPAIGQRGLRTHTHTLMIDRSLDGAESTTLHDNVTDPYQIKNIADDAPGIVAAMTRRMHEWMDLQDDPWQRVSR